MEDKNYIVYKNLYAEIVRKSISLDEMAKSLGITYSTLMAKLSGKETFTLEEERYIQKVFFPETNDFDLFQELITG